MQLFSLKSFHARVMLISAMNILKCYIPNTLILCGMTTVLGSPSLLSVVGSIILVNLKEAGERGQNEGTSYRTASCTIPTMDFLEHSHGISTGRSVSNSVD